VAWTTLNRYVKGLALVGLVDATAIAIGLLILDVPLVAPLSILVFLGAFLPVVGAFASGLFAVAVAGVNGGLTQALIVLAIVVAVQQLEGDVILPLIFGRAMQLHPLVILLAIAVGGVAFGIVGAFLSVPVAAVVVAVNQELSPDPDGSLISLAQMID
jgi:predicted PurR-regulated permease PerM